MNLLCRSSFASTSLTDQDFLRDRRATVVRSTAVNFGTAEWVPFGRAAVEAYVTSSFKRNAVFSHERVLLETGRRHARSFASPGGVSDEARAPWIASVARMIRDDLFTIAREQRTGRDAALTRGVRVSADDDCLGGRVTHDHEVVCAECKSMPYLAVARCETCWKLKDHIELSQAIARARAQGKSAAGAALALGNDRAKGAPYGGTTREGRRDLNRPVFCLKHALGGACGHPARERVVNTRVDVREIEDLARALGEFVGPS